MDRAKSYQLKVDDEIRDDEHFTDYISPEDNFIPLPVPHHGDYMHYWSFNPASNIYAIPAARWSHVDPGSGEPDKPVWTPARTVAALKEAHLDKHGFVYTGWTYPMDRPSDPSARIIFGSAEGEMITPWQQPLKTKGPTLVELAARQLKPVKVPSGAIENTITEAAWITTLEEDWDQRGAKTIKVALFNIAAGFLRTYDKYLNSVGKQLLSPEINPCPDGSIDLSWRTAQARLLININEREEITYANFYGDKFNDRFQFKGQTEATDFFESLASWMKFLSK